MSEIRIQKSRFNGIVILLSALPGPKADSNYLILLFVKVFI